MIWGVGVSGLGLGLGVVSLHSLTRGCDGTDWTRKVKFTPLAGSKVSGGEWIRVRVRVRVRIRGSGASTKTGAIPILVLPSFRCDAAAREEEKQHCRNQPPGNSRIHCRTVCSTPCPEPATVLLRSLRCRGVFVPVRAMGLLPPTDVRVSAINAPFRTAAATTSRTFAARSACHALTCARGRIACKRRR